MSKMSRDDAQKIVDAWLAREHIAPAPTVPSSKVAKEILLDALRGGGLDAYAAEVARWMGVPITGAEVETNQPNKGENK